MPNASTSIILQTANGTVSQEILISGSGKIDYQ
jgi:hypothetical protein